jgi:hypothetical protein
MTEQDFFLSIGIPACVKEPLSNFMTRDLFQDSQPTALILTNISSFLSLWKMVLNTELLQQNKLSQHTAVWMELSELRRVELNLASFFSYLPPTMPSPRAPLTWPGRVMMDDSNKHYLLFSLHTSLQSGSQEKILNRNQKWPEYALRDIN